MTDQHYRTLSDGSIDYKYYTERGHRMRNEAAHELFAGIVNVIGRLAVLAIGRATSGGGQTGAGAAANTAARAKPERYVWRVG